MEAVIDNYARYYSVKTAFLGKILFYSYYPKCSQPVRLKDCFIINISGRNQ